MKKTYEQWCDEFKDYFKILDPDGFDRTREESFTTDVYTRADFLRRVGECTYMWIKSFKELDDLFEEKINE